MFHAPWAHRAVCVLGLASLLAPALAAQVWRPSSDDAVVETLPRVTLQRAPIRPSTAAPQPELAARWAREAIDTARQTGDDRYWGRAQAWLQPWRGVADAPVEIQVLEATVLQGRHEFDAAVQRLRQAVARAPGHAQAWLTLATLYKLQARYSEAEVACQAVVQAGAGFHGRVCAVELAALRGVDDASAWAQLVAMASGPGDRAWVWSLRGEHEERQGRAQAAVRAYQTAQAVAPDRYTALVLGDVLLRLGRPDAALQALRDQPDTDSVLIRRAAALKAMGDPGWSALRATWIQRWAEADARGDDATPQARERAWAAWRVDGDAALAWHWAQRNLSLQKEPIDWWLAAQTARASGHAEAGRAVLAQARKTGLRDARLYP